MKYFIILIILCMRPLNAEIEIIASQTCQIEELSSYEIKNLFMIKKSLISNQAVIILDRSEKDIYKFFLKQYLKKSTRKMKVYWVRMLFTGKKIAPKKISMNKLITLDTNNSCYITYSKAQKKPKDWKSIKIK